MILKRALLNEENLNSAFLSKTATGKQIMSGNLRLGGEVELKNGGSVITDNANSQYMRIDPQGNKVVIYDGANDMRLDVFSSNGTKSLYLSAHDTSNYGLIDINGGLAQLNINTNSGKPVEIGGQLTVAGQIVAQGDYPIIFDGRAKNTVGKRAFRFDTHNDLLRIQSLDDNLVYAAGIVEFNHNGDTTFFHNMEVRKDLTVSGNRVWHAGITPQITDISTMNGDLSGADYPAGVTMFQITNNSEYPVSLGTVLTMKSSESSFRMSQMLIRSSTTTTAGESWIRTWRSDSGWSTWRGIWDSVNLPNPAKSLGQIEDFNISEATVIGAIGITGANMPENYVSLLHVGGKSNGAFQIAGTYSSSENFYVRRMRDTTNAWGSWRELYHSGKAIETNSKIIAKGGWAGIRIDTTTDTRPEVDLWIGGARQGLLTADTDSVTLRNYNAGTSKTGLILYDNYAEISTYLSVTGGDIVLNSGNGRGIKFWNAASGSYSIYMSNTGDTAWGGRLSTNSDYHMYFKMQSGTNRGFAFKNGGTVVAEIAGDGTFRSKRLVVPVGENMYATQ